MNPLDPTNFLRFIKTHFPEQAPISWEDTGIAAIIFFGVFGWQVLAFWAFGLFED